MQTKQYACWNIAKIHFYIQYFLSKNFFYIYCDRQIALRKITPQQISRWVRVRVEIRIRVRGNLPEDNFPCIYIYILYSIKITFLWSENFFSFKENIFIFNQNIFVFIVYWHKSVVIVTERISDHNDINKRNNCLNLI